MEGACSYSLVRGVVQDDEDEDDELTNSSLVETEDFPEDFRKYWRRNLNFFRLEDDGGESRVDGWVFWSRQDDSPNRLPVTEPGSEILKFPPISNQKVKDMIRLALRRIILHPICGQSLVQFWAATTTEGRTLLTTQNQPFAIGKAGKSTCGLCDYRMKSKEYKFYGDIGESGEEELGLPGRVFLHRLPESAPDVQCYSLKEYPQRDDASPCHVRVSLALPVLEHSSRMCVGVLELVSSVNAITNWYDKAFLRNLNGVFQELGLASVDPYEHYEMKSKDEDKGDRTTAFHELTSVLESVYKIHKLPLVLAWVPCSACDSLSLCQLSSKVGNYLGAFEANSNHLINFLTVSTGHHLRKGQVTERALSSPNMVYCSDVTQFSLAEYPMVPFARQCKLSGWFTICLRSSYTGKDDYILEFFLPASRKENENALTTVCTILETMKAYSKTFKLASGEELGELLSIEVFDFQNGQRHQDVQSIQPGLGLVKNGGMTLQLGQLDQQSSDAVNDRMDVISTEQDDTVVIVSEGGTTKTQERKRKKTGVRFDISLEDVLQFSALSRKDAAGNLKVSESTLKCICRRYGIFRWPPHKINKQEEEFPPKLPNVGEPSLMELDTPIVGKQDVGTDYSPIEDPHRHFGHKCEGPAESLGVIKSAVKRICKDHGIIQLPNRQVSAVKRLHDGGKMLLDSPSMDAVNTGRSFFPATRNISDKTFSEGNVKMQGREQGKTGVRIEISMEDILRCSEMKLEDAASKLKVSSSTLKRVCRENNISRWPPRNINKVDSPWPSRVEHQGGISRLPSDMPSNQALDGRGINQWPPQDVNKVGSQQPLRVPNTPSNQVSASRIARTMVTMKVFYEDDILRFQLPVDSRLVELQEKIATRLALGVGTFSILYEDEDGDLISITSDEDLQEYIRTSSYLVETVRVVLRLKLKKPMTDLCK